MIRPDPSPQTHEFWEAAAEGRLLLRRCPACGRWLHPRSRDCLCGEQRIEWRAASGRGTLVSATVTRRSTVSHLADEVPFTVLLVRTAEGVQLVSGLSGDAGALHAGQALEVCFEEIGGGLAVPRFRPTASRTPSAR